MSQATAAKANAQKKFTFRGKGLEELQRLAASGNNEKIISDELAELFDAKTRRRVKRGISEKYAKFINKVRKSKNATAAGEKPVPVKTHYRSMIVSKWFLTIVHIISAHFLTMMHRFVNTKLNQVENSTHSQLKMPNKWSF